MISKNAAALAICLLLATIVPCVAKDPTFSAPAGDTPADLNAIVSDPKLQLSRLDSTFSKFDVCVFIDKSGSMSEPDCPDHMSRWQWCQSETRQLINAVDPVKNHRVNVVLFSESFDERDDADLADIGKLFQTNKPYGGTLLSQPLAHQLEIFFGTRFHNDEGSRRLLVAVITDGAIKDMDALNNLIIRTSQRVNDDKTVRLVFMQIGQDEEGTAALHQLDDQLHHHGCAFDIIDYVPFDLLARKGLTTALVDEMSAILKPAPDSR